MHRILLGLKRNSARATGTTLDSSYWTTSTVKAVLPDTVSIRGLDTVVVTNSIVRGRISDYILIASRRYD